MGVASGVGVEVETEVEIDAEVAVGGAGGHPSSAASTASTISLITTFPLLSTSAARHWESGMVPSAMSTMVTSSLTATIPSPLQSPGHPCCASSGTRAAISAAAPTKHMVATLPQRTPGILDIVPPFLVLPILPYRFVPIQTSKPR